MSDDFLTFLEKKTKNVKPSARLLELKEQIRVCPPQEGPICYDPRTGYSNISPIHNLMVQYIEELMKCTFTCSVDESK